MPLISSTKRPKPNPKANKNKIGLAILVAIDDQNSFLQTTYCLLVTAQIEKIFNENNLINYL